MTKPYHLYVVEDDAAVRGMLRDYLEKQGMVVTAMSSAEELLKRLHRMRPDLVVLDVSLPGMTGLQACQKLRAEGDKVLGLEMGADDFLGKPFSARELLARVHAVLRRAVAPPGQPALNQAPVRFGDNVFDISARCLARRGELRVLGTVEFAVLAELVTNPGVAISRERLLAVSHSRAEELLMRAVDVSIMRLRKLVEPDPSQPLYIQTVRGHGYMFVPGSSNAVAASA